jgi:hypothetical protein
MSLPINLMRFFFSSFRTTRCLILVLFLVPIITSCKTVALPPEIQAASYVLRGIKFYFAYMMPSEITVQSTGAGSDEKEAIDKALVAAVQQAMGVLVVSELTASDEKVLTDLAGMYSSGIVKSFERLNCTGTKAVECTIEAKVVPLGIRDSIFSNKSTQIVDGNSLYGQFSSAKASLIQRRKLTEYYLSRIRSIGLIAKIKSIDAIPSMGANAKIDLSYSIGWNDNFRSEIISFLKHISDRPVSEADLYAEVFGLNKKVGDISSEDPNDVQIRWGRLRGLFAQEVTVKTYDRSFAKMIREKLREPIQFEFSPFGLCDSFEPYDYSGVLIFASSRPVIRTLRFKVSPEILQKTNQVKITTGCAGYDPKLLEPPSNIPVY